MIKAIVFDVDGVLVINKEVFSQIYAKKHKLSAEEMAPFFKGPFQECLIGKADLKEILNTHVHRVFRHKGSIDEFLDIWFRSEHNVDEKVIAFVRELRKRGLTVAIATNQEKYRTKYIQDVMGFGKHFHHIFSSAQIGHMKPSRDFFAHVQKSLNVAPDEILFFDDSVENVKGARSFGLNAHLYSNLEECKILVERELRAST